MIDVSVAPAHANTANTASTSAPSSSAQLPPISTPLERRHSLAEESPFWFWQLILITTAWLHLHYHTPHLACGLLLKILRNIFLCLGLVKNEDKIPITLTTTFKRLGLNEHFEIRAICPQCRRAYPGDSPADLLCTHCHVPLFDGPPAPTSVPVSLLASTRRKTPPKARPVLQSPYLLPSTQLVEFLNREGNELNCESYLTRTPIPGKMQDIQDGEVCQSLKGPDGRKFFETGPDRPDPDELRIGLCFGEDGFGFTRTNNAGTHTSGAASFCVTALPHHRRYRPRNLLLTSIGPGPHEETADEIQRSFAATVTDLLKLYDEGILVRTPKHPNGCRVRVILVAVCWRPVTFCAASSAFLHNLFPGCPPFTPTQRIIRLPVSLARSALPPLRTYWLIVNMNLTRVRLCFVAIIGVPNPRPRTSCDIILTRELETIDIWGHEDNVVGKSEFA
ncbi:hypothetical protein C8R44DRAFT_929268 [Mycena epipterygia]|nr:hypothetical protein C8R44DRAFT_929268 [Mycena epipterygia]